MTMRFFPNEEWKEIKVECKLEHRYAISNYGRLIRFEESVEDGYFLKGTMKRGYKVFTYSFKLENKKINKFKYVRKLVAENFLKRNSTDQVYVLLLDNNRNNNFVGNLKWATKQELREHRKKNPAIIDTIKRLVAGWKKKEGHKLSSDKVKIIKRKLFDPNRKTRMKILARQYGISEMQLYRIKTGENWGHVIVDLNKKD